MVTAIIVEIDADSSVKLVFFNFNENKMVIELKNKPITKYAVNVPNTYGVGLGCPYLVNIEKIVKMLQKVETLNKNINNTITLANKILDLLNDLDKTRISLPSSIPLLNIVAAIYDELVAKLIITNNKIPILVYTFDKYSWIILGMI